MRLDRPELTVQLKAQGFDGTVALEPCEHLARDGAALRRSMELLRQAAMQQSAG